MAAINQNNYFQKSEKIDFSSLPAPLQKGHEMVVKASKNGTDWSMYEKSETIRNTINLYFDKLSLITNQNVQVVRVPPIEDARMEARRKAEAADLVRLQKEAKRKVADHKTKMAAKKKKGATPAKPKQKDPSLFIYVQDAGSQFTLAKVTADGLKYEKASMLDCTILRPEEYNKAKSLVNSLSKTYPDKKFQVRQGLADGGKVLYSKEFICKSGSKPVLEVVDKKPEAKFAPKKRKVVAHKAKMASKKKKVKAPKVSPKKAVKAKTVVPKKKTVVAKKKTTVAKKAKAEKPTKVVAPGNTHHLTDEIKLIKRFSLLAEKPKKKEQILGFIRALQKAIKEKKVTKTSPNAAVIRGVQDRAVKFYNFLEDKKVSSGVMELKDSAFKSQLDKIIQSKKVYLSVPLLKRYISFQGISPSVGKVEALLKSIENGLKNNRFKNDPYLGEIKEVQSNLKNYLKTGTGTIDISEMALAGLMGIPQLAGLKVKPCGCKKKSLNL